MASGERDFWFYQNARVSEVRSFAEARRKAGTGRCRNTVLRRSSGSAPVVRARTETQNGRSVGRYVEVFWLQVAGRELLEELGRKVLIQ